MKRFIEANRHKVYFPEALDLEVFVAPDHPARAIAALVDELDTGAIEATYDIEGSGRSPFHPRLLLSIGLLAIDNGRFTLRKMECDLKTNLVYKWLAGCENPDHSTLGNFFANHAALIVDLFSQVVVIAVERELVEFKTLAVDSMKLRGDASYKQFRNEEGFQRELENLKEKIRGLIGEAVADGAVAMAEMDRLQKRKLAVEAARVELRRRVEEAHATGKKEPKKINVTDHDCYHIMQGNGEKNAGYSVTTAVDTANDIIVGFAQQVGGMNDAASLFPVLAESATNCGKPHEEVVADPGFASFDNYEQLEKQQQAALVPDQRLDVEERGETSKGMYDRSRFNYDAGENSYRCPQEQILAHAETVQANGRLTHRYTNRAACGACPCRKRCTRGAFRTICRDDKETFREKMRARLAQIENRKRYSERAHAAESPYGNIKLNRKFVRHQRRGGLKTLMEDALLFMLHNGRKIFGTAPPVPALVGG